MRDIKTTRDNLVVSCPSHSNGQERKASCGISLRNRLTSDGRQIPAGTVHCFSCGYTASLTSLISHCFGHNDGGAFGTQWLLSRFYVTDVDSRRPLSLNMSREISTAVYVSEEELSRYRYVHSYMYDRKMTDDVIERFDVGYDHETDCITFPVRDVTGGVVSVQRRAVKGKRFVNDTSSERGSVLYGLYEATQVKATELYVCESIIDSLTLWSKSKPSVALMGAVPTATQIDMLIRFPARHIILALDNDKAGLIGQDTLISRLRMHKMISRVLMPSGVKDINDMSDDELSDIQTRPIL